MTRKPNQRETRGPPPNMEERALARHLAGFAALEARVNAATAAANMRKQLNKPAPIVWTVGPRLARLIVAALDNAADECEHHADSLRGCADYEADIEQRKAHQYDRALRILRKQAARGPGRA